MQGKYSLDEAMKCVTENYPSEYERYVFCAVNA